jgi:copper chaperone CopZ
MQDHPEVRRRVRVTMTRGEGGPSRQGEPLHFDLLGGAALTPRSDPGARPRKRGSTASATKVMNMEKAAYGVPGIDEEGGEVIRKRLERLPGVQKVTVWLSEQKIDVTYDPDVVGPGTLVDTIQDLGYLAKHVPWAQPSPG